MVLLSSLTMEHWLLLSNCALLAIGVVAFVMTKRQYQREAAEWQQQAHKIHHEYNAIVKSTVGMGRRMKKLEQRLSETERKPALASADEALFQQAQRLVGMGASAEDLVNSCGVARAEAELLVSMNRQVAH